MNLICNMKDCIHVGRQTINSLRLIEKTISHGYFNFDNTRGYNVPTQPMRSIKVSNNSPGTPYVKLSGYPVGPCRSQ